MPAPVVLFTFNRPMHTRKVLDALAACDGARDTLLYVYADGPRTDKGPEEEAQVAAVRALLREENRFLEVQVVEREENFGLGRSIIDGVSRIIRQHGRVIVLEDDLVVHPSFLRYMNYYLDAFEHQQKVYHVCGFQRESWLQFFLKPTYCTRFMNCSGWGTWADRWEQLNLDLAAIETYLKRPEHFASFNYHILEMSNQLELNRERLRTWAIFWYATIQMKGGLCINPRFSFVQNIGDDGSGTNMGKTDKNRIRNPAYSFEAFDPILEEGSLARLHIREGYGKKSKLKLNKIKSMIFIFLTSLRNYPFLKDGN
jgi:hypothetical protein